MNDILKPGQVIQCEPSGMPCTIEVLLGAGGQGEVYKADRQCSRRQMVFPAHGNARTTRLDGIAHQKRCAK